jgi:four helix bundle protein
MSIGSASELQYLLLLAHDLGYIAVKAHPAHDSRVVEIKRMLTAFLKKLQSDSRNSGGGVTDADPR